MASNLYEVLGLDHDASPETGMSVIVPVAYSSSQTEVVRKAYRKKALSTHPDRLPPNTSEAERQAANEQFRLVRPAPLRSGRVT